MRWLLVSLLAVAMACSDAMEATDNEAPTTPELSRAGFEMSARVLGLVQHDDDADLRITLKETNGVAAHLSSLVLTCTNGVQRHWGADRLVADHGTNRIEGGGELVIVRHYLCPSSGRPSRLEATLDDANGFRHRVVAVPFHPDWPGV